MDPSHPDLSGIPGPGASIGGKYQVERLLGAGGMGVVLAARHQVLGQPVAIKFLLPGAARLPDASERFLREAKAAASITSEHVARVLDVGTLESGAPYMVMEYLAGADLGRLVKTRGPLPPAEAVDLVLQGCEAIAEAHALGIVHRDLKLGNLFLTARADGSSLVKVLDFGLSKTISGAGAVSEASLTATDVILGSPYYMAPEQIRSLKTVDARADIWALGVILYVMLSARRPFGGETASAICASVAADLPAPLVSVRADLPPALDAVIGRCLEKDVARRFQTVAELACALAPFGSTQAAISVERIVRVLPGGARPPSMPFAVPMPGAPGHPESTGRLTGGDPTRSVPVAALAMAGPFVMPTAPFTGHTQSVPAMPGAPSGPVASQSQSVAAASRTRSGPLEVQGDPVAPPATPDPDGATSGLVPRGDRSVAGVSWGQPGAMPARSRSSALIAAIAGGAVLGALGLVGVVWVAARPGGQAAVNAAPSVTMAETLKPAATAVTVVAAAPSPVAEPPPSAVEPAPTATPTVTETVTVASPSASPATTRAGVLASPRKATGVRKAGDPLLDRWK